MVFFRTFPKCLGVLAASVLLSATESRADAPLSWKPSTQSPRSAAPAEASHAALHALCGGNDAALAEVAARSVRRHVEAGSILEPDELALSLRAAGDPHVWPRGWALSGSPLDDEEILKRVRAWVANWPALGARRCGIARAKTADGKSVVAAVAVDALADLTPIPTSARVGQWISLDATMLVPTREAKVVLLGPRGAPKTVVASLSGNRIRSSFALDQPGPWRIQVLSTVSTGPRPVLEAMVFAGTKPPTQFVESPAPGEDEGAGIADDEAVFKMVNAARASEQLPPLRRDPALDKVARAHSEEMSKTRVVGHDLGTGDPTSRLRAAGITQMNVAGENVASANTLKNAHRALWASPSHRGNLLYAGFGRVGIAVVRAPDGRVWVTEMFTG